MTRAATFLSPVPGHAKNRLVALTMGDACGIGPEVLAKLWRQADMQGCFVVGDVGVMRRAIGMAAGMLAVASISEPADALAIPPNCIGVLQVQGLPGDLLAAPMGRVDVRAGRAAAASIEVAAQCARQGAVAAIVTAPVHKEAMALAGVPYPGHTEMLQALASPGRTPAPVRMMLANDELRTVLVTIHMSLRDAIAAVTFEAVLETIGIAHAAAQGWGQPRPRIAVAGLNPHAGEGGLFGDEELRIIGPAIEAARRLGIDASGPYAPDTVFMRARHAPTPSGAMPTTLHHVGEFDIVVAMTHDHGLIPVKYLGVENGVNVTLGLPFVRTSPDHGTAFDIAGSGKADASSIAAALRMARRLISG